MPNGMVRTPPPHSMRSWLMRWTAICETIGRPSKASDALADLPQRCKRAPESRSFPFEVRELHYGHKPHLYRILFAIEDNTVVILHIVHGRRLPLSAQ